MINALVRQNALVLVEQLPDGSQLDMDDLTKPVNRIKKADLWQCFHTNQTLKVVQAPIETLKSYPYTINHPYAIVYQGWLLRGSETYSLEKAIAYCDLCIKNIILKILAFLDQEYPDPEADDDDLFDIELANMLVEIAS